MPFTIVNPKGWAKPVGYNNGIKAESGNLLFISGQVAWDNEQKIVGLGDFVKQFDQTLANVLAVVSSAGGQAQNLTQLTIYVTNKQDYLARLKEIGEVYRLKMGKHYPAMTLVEVKSLLEPGAEIEMDGMAVI